MFRITQKEQLAPGTFSYWVEAADIASAYKPGQFLILRVDAEGERIPLTIVDTQLDKGLLRIIFSVVGKSSYCLSQLNVGDAIQDVVGPLGNATHIENYGTVAVVGGGVGIAPIYPITRAMKKAGNRIISILGARNGELLILHDDMKSLSEQVIVTTDDGSLGKKGFVTDALRELIDAKNPPIDFVLAVGPLIMMKAVSELTRGYGIKTMVSLNTMMVDGTGMCGGCRCSVEGKARFACVHGPEFDGHEVNFDEIMRRQTMFRDKEKRDYDKVRGL